MIEPDPKPSPKEPGGSRADGYIDPAKVVFLDPARAVRAGGGALLPTAYVVDRLIVRQGVLDAIGDLNKGFADSSLGVTFRVARSSVPDPRLELSRLALSTYELVSDDPLAPVDAWEVLQRIRASDVAAKNAVVAEGFSLDHVLFPCGGGWGTIGGGWGTIGGGWGTIGGGWGTIGGGWGTIGSPAEYGVPGRGGRMPAHLALDDPWVQQVSGRRPVIATLDSGVGPHPWFDSRVEVPAAPTSEMWFDGNVPLQVGATYRDAASGAYERVGSTNADRVDGVVDTMTGAFGPSTGHGTFVAGILRMGAPSARILSIPVLGADGLAEEGFVLHVLHRLLANHIAAMHSPGVDAAGLLDVLSISLGYYHEDSDDAAVENDLAAALREFGAQGVLVVAGSGNDATTRRMFPAGFASRLDAVPSPPGVPLTSVGALNPDGRTVALFSNDGSWVLTHRRGVNVVSTLPSTVNAGAQSGAMASGPTQAPRPRATLDPDDYNGGFGIWSGTSFATPVLSAQLARHLGQDSSDAKAGSRDDRIARGKAALRAVLAESG